MRQLSLLFLLTTILSANENGEPLPTNNQMIGSLQEQKDVIVIDPKQRAQDFSEAYAVIKRGKSPQKIQFHLSDGRVLTNVVEMSSMTNGTLLLFTIGTSLGNQYELVPIEKLVTISQL